MRFVVLVLTLALFLGGCKRENRISETFLLRYVHKACIDNLAFLIFDTPTSGGITQILGDDGKPVKCKTEKEIAGG